jgi:hypothetical protein
MTARAKEADGKVIFRRVEVLLGEARRRETIRMDEEIWATVVIGETYLIGYTRLRRPPRTHGIYEIDPAGARLLIAPAVGSMLLADTAPLRVLILPPADDEEPAARARLEVVFAALEGEPDVAARFAAAELLFGSALQQVFGEADIAQFSAVITRAASDPQLQDLLLKACVPLAGLAGGEWLAAISRQVLAAHGTKIDFASYVPAVLESAAKALAVVGQGDDASALEPHLRSTHPGVAKAVIASLDALDPAAARRAAAAAVATADLPSENRRVLERYLGGAKAGS